MKVILFGILLIILIINMFIFIGSLNITIEQRTRELSIRWEQEKRALEEENKVLRARNA
jgi:predicted Holliday junction resolvase-like endonuclease